MKNGNCIFVHVVAFDVFHFLLLYLIAFFVCHCILLYVVELSLLHCSLLLELPAADQTYLSPTIYNSKTVFCFDTSILEYHQTILNKWRFLDRIEIARVSRKTSFCFEISEITTTYMLMATQGNSRNARNSRNKQTNATIKQTMQTKFTENVTSD